MPLDTISAVGGIDCDIHPAVRGAKTLMPYLDPYWRESVTLRGIDVLDLTDYPPSVPLSCRSDWRSADGAPADLPRLQAQALDAFGSDLAICNVLFGGQFAMNPHFAAALCRATNDWLAAEWLDQDRRLRGSIVVPRHNVAAAVAEIERLGPDSRFVQVLTFAGDDGLLGNQRFWPILEAAERHDLTIGIHAGSSYRHAPTGTGFPSYRAEEYVSHAAAFEAQLMNLVVEGALAKFPKLRVTLIESGVSWLPIFLWRFDKLWRGLRVETPWVDRRPTEIVRDHFFFTVQPLDAPDGARQLERLAEEVGSEDLWLYATDYPHWQFDGSDALPPTLAPVLRRKAMVDNPLKAYPRLTEVSA